MVVDSILADMVDNMEDNRQACKVDSMVVGSTVCSKVLDSTQVDSMVCSKVPDNMVGSTVCSKVLDSKVPDSTVCSKVRDSTVVDNKLAYNKVPDNMVAGSMVCSRVVGSKACSTEVGMVVDSTACSTELEGKDMDMDHNSLVCRMTNKVQDSKTCSTTIVNNAVTSPNFTISNLFMAHKHLKIQERKLK